MPHKHFFLSFSNLFYLRNLTNQNTPMEEESHSSAKNETPAKPQETTKSTPQKPSGGSTKMNVYLVQNFHAIFTRLCFIYLFKSSSQSKVSNAQLCQFGQELVQELVQTVVNLSLNFTSIMRQRNSSCSPVLYKKLKIHSVYAKEFLYPTGNFNRGACTTTGLNGLTICF